MRNFVPALEESLMKFSPSDVTGKQPEATYTAHGGWFSVDSFTPTSGSKTKTKTTRITKKKIIKKGARA